MWIDKTGVALLDEHELKDSDGKTIVKVDRARLEKIADNNNRRIEETGDYVPFVVGHTSDDAPEDEQPQIVGYATKFYVGPLGKTGRYAIHADAKFMSNKKDVINSHPRRSVELWLDDWKIDPIALLGATTPERDLGLLQLSRQGRRKLRRILPAGMPTRYASRIEQDEQGRYIDTAVTRPRGSWRWQNAFGVARHRPKTTKDGRRLWESAGAYGKYSEPQIRPLDLTFRSLHNRPLPEAAPPGNPIGDAPYYGYMTYPHPDEDADMLELLWAAMEGDSGAFEILQDLLKERGIPTEVEGPPRPPTQLQRTSMNLRRYKHGNPSDPAPGVQQGAGDPQAAAVAQAVVSLLQETEEWQYLRQMIEDEQRDAMMPPPDPLGMGMGGIPPLPPPGPEQPLGPPPAEGPPPESEGDEDPARYSASYASGTNTFTPRKMSRPTQPRQPAAPQGRPDVRQLLARLQAAAGSRRIQMSRQERHQMALEQEVQDLRIRYQRAEREKDLIQLEAEGVLLNRAEELDAVSAMPERLYKAYVERVRRNYQRVPVGRFPLSAQDIRADSGPGGRSREEAQSVVDYATENGVSYEAALKALGRK